MRHALASLLVLGALAAPSQVQAAPFSPGLEYAYRVANRYWGGPPMDCTSIDFEIVPDLSLPGEAAAEATLPVEPEACTLYVSRFLARPSAWPLACAVIIHEDGHLHGLEHSDDPSNIMYWTIERVPSVCKPPQPIFRYHHPTFNDR